MNEPQDLNTPNLRDHAVKAAQGKTPFDMLIIGGQLVDMVTGKLRYADIGIIGSMIASVHKVGQFKQAKQIINADGLFISPGLIDTHMHVESSMVTPETYTQNVLPRGVTTIVWDPHELANVSGLLGVDYALKAASKSPLRMITLAPSCVPSAPGFETTGADFTPEILEQLLERENIHGVAEVMAMRSVLDGGKRMTDIVQAGLASGKRVCGHARSLEGSELNAYVAAGVSTDHELTSADDLQAKLEAGLTIEMRGSHDHLLPEFVERLNELGDVPQTLTLCTDDIFADDLYKVGGLNDVVKRLVKYGLDPIKTLRAATLNAATQIGRADLGLIAPGKRADIVLFEDLADFKAKIVITNGEKVAENGSLTISIQPTDIPLGLLKSVKTDEFNATHFRIKASGKRQILKIIERPRFTQWGEREVEVQDGYAICPSDMTRMAVINRFGKNTPPQVAFLAQWGVWKGAFATTVSHDAHNLTIFGGDEENMAIAANTIRDMDGGLVVVADGKILASLALPIGGLLSSQPLEEVAKGFSGVRNAMDQIIEWQPPYLIFKACFGASLVCNAGPHLSDLGIVDTE